MKKLILVLISIVLLSVCTAEARTIEAEGEAAVVEGNVSAAREEAKRQLYRNALERAIGARVEGITEMKDFQVVRDRVFSGSRGLVKNLEILKEWRTKDGVLHLKGRCEVEETALDGVLGPAVIDALGNPRVVVLVDEMIGDDRPFLSAAEGEVESAFQRAGYLMLDKGQLDAIASKRVEAARIAGDEAELAELARDFDADVLIFGKGQSSSFTAQKISGQTIYGVRTLLKLKAVIAQTGQSLAVEVPEVRSKGFSERDGAVKGLKEAAENASSSLVNEVAYALTGGGNGVPGRSVRVSVDGMDFGSIRELEAALRESPGVVGVYRRSFRSGRLELDVTVDGTAEDVAVILDGRGLEVVDLTAATVGARRSK
jgi:hypothetical protein